ncbi:uncharacterized protein L969DRAFT_73647 [Mixia osmundae IAM 14324]|uniref:Inositol-1-monophosphatase n=1 Tax=Mixia osmundae (strain CBS 9802 / IAM 14324 / JCM 22182 / KY 12970) TaxID=764103 RepID=G7E8T7_MIXOS|nr:uncharacterized protein L969DRAFT_73647 [Mixia osmundae IAM 14324]KEI40191.1 hypothetical protein L969DRAFT_73647 [Mixia osmundae IAM 14324]GAA99555.1 hypothetical protein E5Q_06256 [Mixia osmundae IAM 14324]
MAIDDGFESELNFSIDLARRAGAIIKEASAKRWQNANVQIDSSKKNRVDLVTETDQRVEKVVKEAIAQTFPQHKFIGEESFAAGEKAELTDEPTFIVDPIDGTTNFAHGFPWCCISIGLAYKKQPVLGVIYNPFLELLYSARKGHGAWLNESTRLPLSHPNPLPLASLGDAVICVEWGSDRSKAVMEAKGESFTRLAGDPTQVKGGIMAHSLRSLGSAALNYCAVAAGQMDLYHEIGCWAWDVTGGAAIAREAGAKVYARNGKELQGDDLMGHHFLVVRAIAPTDSETSEQVQDRIVKEFMGAVTEYDV